MVAGPRGIKPERLVCHGHTGFGVAVLFLMIAMSFNRQHGHVADSVTVAPKLKRRRHCVLATICGDSTLPSLESPPEADPNDRDLFTDDA